MYLCPMEALDRLLLLGDPRLYEVCAPVDRGEIALVGGWVEALHGTMEAIRKRYNFGRGIAAPQLGILKRLIYIHIDEPIVIINPELHDQSEEMFEVWDDCMCFPNLLVRVRRHCSLTVRYLDGDWKEREWKVEGALSELIQHEYDHLEGVLCTMRAIDDKSFKWRI